MRAGRILALVLLSGSLVACGGSASSHMIGPSPIGSAGRSASVVGMMGGSWMGSFVDGDHVAMVEWMLTQQGTHFGGYTSWADGHGHHGDWSFSGDVVSDHEFHFTWVSPGGHMVGSIMATCPVTFEGVGQLSTDATGRTSLQGSYTATSTCDGPVGSGRFTLNHRS